MAKGVFADMPFLISFLSRRSNKIVLAVSKIIQRLYKYINI